MGILFNVLDSRTYGHRDMAYVEILQMNEFDYNDIPEEDRRSYVYARGLSLELISWLDCRIIVTGIDGNAQETLQIEDLQVEYITRQGLNILQYLEGWTAEEEMKDDPSLPIVEKDSLKRQLTWAMKTISWIQTSWSETLKEENETFYLQSLYPDSCQPLPRKEIETYIPCSKTPIFSFLLSSLTF